MKKSILVIDDDHLIPITLQNVFCGAFNFTHEVNGLKGLQNAETNLPDIILLDVEMPGGMDGYEVCEKLKNNQATKYIPVIFISAHTDISYRINGYDAGGDDYIAKPILPEELTRKIAVLLRNRRQNAEIEETIASASKITKLALQSMGDAAMLLNFMREIAANSSFAQMAETTLNILTDNDLDASIQLRTNSGVISRNSQGVCSPLEESMLMTVSKYGRISDLGRRSAFSYDRVTIAVNKMPKNDPENYGRLKDLIALLAEVIDVQIGSTDQTLAAIKRGDTLLNLLQRDARALRDIEARYRQHNASGVQILDNLLTTLQDSFQFLGLSEGQENYIQNLAKDTLDKFQTNSKQVYETEAILKVLGDDLEATIYQELQNIANVQADSASEPNIELF